MSSSDERTLATDLAARETQDLVWLFQDRGISDTVTWRDFYDAAAALLDASSIERALVRAPRHVIDFLHTADTVDTEESISWLWRRALSTPDGVPYRTVHAILERADEKLASNGTTATPESAGDPRTSGDSPAPEPPLCAPATEVSDIEIAAAAEHAFTAVSSLTDILISRLHSPIGRVGTGSVGANDRRRLIEAGAVSDAEELEDLLGIAETAGLVRSVKREWLVTTGAEEWLDSSTVDRWRHCAQAMLHSLPDGVRTPEGALLPTDAWRDAYPRDPDWAHHVARQLRWLTRWAVFLPDGTPPPWTKSAEDGAPADDHADFHLPALHDAFPAEIDRLFLQADLSAIAPGPLLPPLERRLRTMATRESRAQASTYRFSSDSLSTAIAAGETAATLREFLSEISLTGIPQPLDYLIDRAAERHGLVRVGVDESSGRTRVDSSDGHLLATIAVDQTLRAMGLVPAGNTLTTKVGRDAVYWTLIDAGYPAVAVSYDGTKEPVQRRDAAASRTEHAEPDYTELVAHLRASMPADADADAAWRERELDQAVRDKATLIVEVSLPGGAVRSFTLEATGVGGGRLRGRDRVAEVERTVPISHITRIERG